MKNLKNSAFGLVLAILAIGCQNTAKKFQMNTNEKEELNVIEVDSNRIVQECYFLNAEKENNWRHQYILYILNEKNEAIPLFNPTNQGKSECLAHLKKVERVLEKETRMKLCARGILEKMPDNKRQKEFHDFGPLGKHESPYWALTFDTICNSKECYSISDTWNYTCTDPDFRK